MFVYLIRCNEFSKIGIAIDLIKRVDALQVGNPYNLYLHDAYSFSGHVYYVESTLHALFEEKSKRGEWFQLDGSDLDKFKDFCLNNGGTPARDEYYKSVKMSYADRVVIEDKTTDRADVIKLLRMCLKYNAIRKIKDKGIIYSSQYLKVNSDWHASIIDVLVKHDLVTIKKDGTIRITRGRKIATILDEISDEKIVIRRRKKF